MSTTTRSSTHPHRAVAPSYSKTNGDFLLQAAHGAGITECKELANFMGQMQVESHGFTKMNESLNYSGERLLEVFKGRNGLDALETANAVAAGGPEKIAEAIYGGEWGRRKGGPGNTESGDGYLFRGRGFVQLTGRANYEHYGKALGLDLINNPELAAEPTNAAKIAVQYWKERVVAHHNQDDVKRATKNINGQYNGLKERQEAAIHWNSKLAHGYKPGDPEPGQTLQHKHHPGHTLYEQALHGLQKWNHDHHIKADPQGMKNAAGALAAEGHQQGFKRIDLVEPTPSGDQLIAVQGKPGSALSKVIAVQTMTALNTPLAESSQAFVDAQRSQPAIHHANPQQTAAHPAQQQAAPSLR